MSTTALAPSALSKAVTATSAERRNLASSISLPNLSLTPNKDGKQASSSISTPQKFGTPGRWQHPRLDEVIRRRDATNFDSSNIKAIGFNFALILASFYLPTFLDQVLPITLQPYPSFALYILYAIRLLFSANIASSLLPLFRTPDSCEDVPLTPSQRQLLGLPPMSRPATPAEQEQYVTPPRFARSSMSSSTPRSSSSSLFAEPGASPFSLSGMDSPSLRQQQQQQHGRQNSWGSPFETPSSSLGYGGVKIGGAGANGGKLSFNSTRSSPLSISEFEAVGGSISTPTKGARASVGLNNKWLYEKGRASPGRRSLFS